MRERPTIILGRLRHRGSDCISLRFEKDFDLIREVKKIPGATFSWTHRCWYIVNGQGALDSVLRALKDKATIDDSALGDTKSTIGTYDRKGSVPKRECPAEYVGQLDRMRYSENTKKIYINFFSQFINYFPGIPVDDISDDQVSAYMEHLLARKKVSSSTQNQAINAIKFYYERVRKRERKVYALERPLKELKLPKVLSEEEVIAILKSVDNLKHKAMLWLIYAAGLRRSELINLEVNDIDSQRMVINVRGGKGKKDRITLLSEKVLDLLRRYQEEYKPKVRLFEGAGGEPYSASSLQKIFTVALRKSGVRKDATLHTLRHSFATHLLENRTDIRYIQALLGHNSSKTTEIYTHVTTKAFEKIRSPLDNLDI